MEDHLVIRDLELWTTLGVPEAERARPQRVTATLWLAPAGGMAGLEDRLERTVDYAAVCEAVRARAGGGERRLLETLAEELALGLLAQFPGLAAVEIEVRKYVLPGARYTAAWLRRERGRPEAGSGPMLRRD